MTGDGTSQSFPLNVSNGLFLTVPDTHSSFARLEWKVICESYR